VLVDPDSAKFDGEYVSDHYYIGDTRFDKQAVCGFVNARNKMGGYAGRSPYMYDEANGAQTLAEPPSRQDVDLLNSMSADDASWKERWMSIESGCDFLSRWNKTCAANMKFILPDASTVCAAWRETKGSPSETLQKLSSEP
jgi:hypothetical protein